MLVYKPGKSTKVKRACSRVCTGGVHRSLPGKTDTRSMYEGSTLQLPRHQSSRYSSRSARRPWLDCR